MNSARSKHRILLAALALVAAWLVAAPSRADADAGAAEVIPIAVPLAKEPSAPSADVKGPRDLGPFLGKPVASVAVFIDDTTWTIATPPTIESVRVGQALSGAAARAAMNEVLASGRFAKARAVATLEGPAVRLVVHVSQRRLVEGLRVDLHGTPIDRDEMLRDADLSDGGEILGNEIHAIERRMRDYLTRHGFPSSTATITTRDTDDPTRVLVIVDVVAGPPRVVERRGFYVFGADARELSPVLASYRVQVGARTDEAALESADNALEARLRSRGYHGANVTHDLVVASGKITLRVRVDAGPRTVVRFEGNDHYDQAALAGALDVEDETDLAPSHLVQKLKDFYTKRGYLDVDVALELRGSGDERVRALVFHVTEHARVGVQARTYPCLKLDEIAKLDGGGPRSIVEIGGEIDSYLDEELPGADLFRTPDPKGLDATISGQGERGRRATPTDLDPDATYVPDTYDRAVLHVQELYRNEGYLHAQVGPVHVVRRRCDPRSPPGKCTPIEQPLAPADECTYDTTNLPLPVASLAPSFSCVPDPAHGVECEPKVTLRIPVKLGPRTTLYDVEFAGVHALPEDRIAKASELVLGAPANTLKLEDARRKIIDLYKEEGYAYADVRYTLDASVDHTRARAHFDVSEGEQVIVRGIVIRGNERTNDWTVRRRVALQVGMPYRTSDVRKTQERIATLNVFSNVTVGLEDPYVPQRNKTVIINVSERKSEAIEYSAGLSTGEGVRGEIGYSHANIGGDAIGASVRVRMSYLPDELILDDVVRKNFDTLGKGFSGDRLARRVTGSLTFPEIGLGPLVRMQVDGVLVHDLEHDFVLDKYAAIPGIYYRPFRELQFALSQSFEHNDANIFQYANIATYLQSVQSNADLARLLRFPDGPSHAFAQRFVVTWDRRDNSFNPHSGTLFVSGLEHIDWYAEASNCVVGSDSINHCSTLQGHTLHFTETFAVYVPVTKKITWASEIRVGVNAQIGPGTTYTDRLFFLGGVDSLRGYLQDNLVPQEYANRIASKAFGIDQVAVRGGDLMINPRTELRVPIRPPLDTVLFVDAGNVWQDPTYVVDSGLNLRVTAGSGVRVETPIGPLAFDYGVNVSRLFASSTNPRRGYEDFGAFHFAIGLF